MNYFAHVVSVKQGPQRKKQPFPYTQENEMNYFSHVVSVKQRPQRKKQPFPYTQENEMNYFSQVVSVKQEPQRKKTTVPLYTGKRDELFFTSGVCKTRTTTKKNNRSLIHRKTR